MLYNSCSEVSSVISTLDELRYEQRTKLNILKVLSIQIYINFMHLAQVSYPVTSIYCAYYCSMICTQFTSYALDGVLRKHSPYLPKLSDFPNWHANMLSPKYAHTTLTWSSSLYNIELMTTATWSNIWTPRVCTYWPKSKHCQRQEREATWGRWVDRLG